MNIIQKVKKSSKQVLRSTLHLTAVHDSTPSIGHDCLGVQTKPWTLLRGEQNWQKLFAITGTRFSKLLSNLESWNGVITTLWLRSPIWHLLPLYTSSCWVPFFERTLGVTKTCLQTTPEKSSTRRGKQRWKTNHYDYKLQPLYNISLIRKIEKSWKR
jgi:hypothetical protein